VKHRFTGTCRTAALLAGVWVFLLVLTFGGAGRAANLMGDQSSPYLRSHAKDPVHWQPWSDDAFERARKEGKPVFLSIGYLACHWCHVLQDESFTDPATAAVMNDAYINVLVDREERPDIDAVMMRAADLMGAQTGWPLNMFLTPDGKPFFAGGYFPPEPRLGMPAFRQVVEAAARAYREDRAGLDAFGARVEARLRQVNQAVLGRPADLSRPALAAAARTALADIDQFNGGFGTAPKHPMLPGLGALWRIHLRTGDPDLGAAVTEGLEAMIQGGLYDHLGGGFARYATDPEWKIPHFEKMLLDNALFLNLLTDVWRETRSPLLAQRIAETVAFLMREMRLDGGAFASSLDADSEGEEGRFYVWTVAEIDRVLGEAAPLFRDAYDVTKEGNWEGVTVLNRAGQNWQDLAKSHGMDLSHLHDSLTRSRGRLFLERARRVRPQRDDKVLADWNGAAIAALAEAGAAFGRSEWIAAAETAYVFVRGNMTVGAKLRHAWMDGVVGDAVTLDDFAAMAQAASALSDITQNRAYLTDAKTWIAEAEALWSETDGAYRQSELAVRDGLPALILGEDQPGPAGNAMMADNLAKLSLLTGETAHGKRAERIAQAFLAVAYQAAPYFGGVLASADTLLSGAQVVIVGAPASADTRNLHAAVMAAPIPGRTVTVIEPGTNLPKGHPASGKGLVDGKAAAYVCVGTLCSLPVTEPAQMIETVRFMRSQGYDAAKTSVTEDAVDG